MKQILSCGAGVNSTAILILFEQRRLELTHVVFADTGAEHPETYEYIENVIKPLCAANNLPFTIVKRNGESLYDYYFAHRIIPTRMFRHCTDKFKIQPINTFCRSLEPYQLTIGIDAGEVGRTRDWQEHDYPLIRLGLDRQRCKNLIEDAGLRIPIKSGCYVCPFTSQVGWFNLLHNHSDLFSKAEELERHNRRYPDLTLTSKPLADIRKLKEPQQTLANCSGACLICEIEAEEEGSGKQ